MSRVDFAGKGVEYIQKAVALDNEEKYLEALSFYKKGIESLSLAVKYEKNVKAKARIKEKMIEYLDRAEAVQHIVDTSVPKKKRVQSGGDDSDSEFKLSEDMDPEIAKLEASLAGAVVMDSPNVKWGDVAGLETAKGLLKEAVLLPIKFPQLFTGKRTPWRGILLYGPPGTGKSYLAKAVATEAGASTFFSVSSSDLVSKFQGESERLVKSLFELARAKSPAIIFIDEIDSLCGSRSDGENDSARRIKTEFLVQMQGVGKGNDGILVLGATNTPWDLDPAIRRRFEKRIYIPLPDEFARKRMFQVHIGNTPSDLVEEDYSELATVTNGFSGSDISVIVRDALMEPLRAMSYATHFRKVKDDKWEPCTSSVRGAVTMSLMDMNGDELATPSVCMGNFRSVLTTQKPSVSDGDITRHTEWTAEFGQEG